MPRHIALVTYHELPTLAADDRLLIPALAAHGLDAVPAVWNDPTIDWSRFDAAIVRSTWDYYHDLAAFYRWISHVESSGTRLYNPPGVLRWNADKRYLRDLETRGVAVVPTRWVEGGDCITLAALLDECDWDDAVVKPAVSASAWGTWKTAIARAGEDEPRFRRLAERGTVMVQPLIAEVAREGEWSLLYIGGEFSHAVVKRVRTGDFRVQPRHGGTATIQDPDAGLLGEADSIMRAALTDPARSLYARVDGTVSNGRFLLMELELLEPSLFLGLAAGAPGRLARALAVRLDSA